MKSVPEPVPTKKNLVNDNSMPGWVEHGSGLHLHYAVTAGLSSDAFRTYPWLDTSTEPRVKPWVVALDAKCRLGSDVPAVPTRQSRRAAERAKNWKALKVTATENQDRLPRRARRVLIRPESRVSA